MLPGVEEDVGRVVGRVVISVVVECVVSIGCQALFDLCLPEVKPVAEVVIKHTEERRPYIRREDRGSCNPVLPTFDSKMDLRALDSSQHAVWIVGI